MDLRATDKVSELKYQYKLSKLKPPQSPHREKRMEMTEHRRHVGHSQKLKHMCNWSPRGEERENKTEVKLGEKDQKLQN